MNYGTIRQLDLSVGIAYGSNVNGALELVREVLGGNSRVLKEPPAVVGVTALADSAVVIAVKPWVSVADFGPAGAEINQAILERFRASGIEIPFPQREVRLLGNGGRPSAGAS